MKLACHHGVSNKIDFLTSYLQRNPEHRSFERLAYLGNDLNDLQPFLNAKYTFAPSDAHSMIKQCATHVIDAKGGDGFVRLFIEKILGIDTMTLTELSSFL